MIGNFITSIVYAFTVGLGGIVAYIASYVFGFATHLTLVSEAYSLGFLSVMWGIVRNLANMTFLFILIFIAFQIMFRADTAGTMHTLAAVIVVALLVNFSFFFTRVVIDGGNIIAVQFYNNIEAPGMSTHPHVKDLSAVIMRASSLAPILGNDSFKGVGVTGNIFTRDTWRQILVLSAVYIMLGAMLFMLAAMFLAAGIKFVVRTVVLWISIISAPLIFVAAALPQTRGLAKKGFQIFITHALYPAFFLFMFMVIALFVNDMGDSNLIGKIVERRLADPNDPVAAWQFVTNSATRLAFILVLLYFAMKIADKVSTYGGSFTKKISNNISWGLPRAIFATSSIVGRGTAGVAGKVLSTGAIGRYLATRKGGVSRRLGSAALTVARGAARASYDPRAIPGVRKAVHTVTGIDVGEAMGAGGIERKIEKVLKARREKTRERKKYRDSLIAGAKLRQDKKREQELNSYGVDEVESSMNNTKKKLERNAKNLAAIEGKIQRRNHLRSRSRLSPEEQRELADLQAGDLDTKKGQLEKERVNLNEEKNKLEERKKAILNQENRGVRKGDEKSWEDLLAEREVVAYRLQKAPPGQIVELKSADILSIIKQISEEHLKAIEESGKHNAEAIAEIKKKWHEESRRSPLVESRGHMDSLEKTISKLHEMSVNLPKISSYTSPPSGKIEIDLKAAEEMRGEIESERIIQEHNQDRRGATEAEKLAARQRIKWLNAALRHVEGLETKLKDIPEEVGNVKRPSAFEHRIS